MLSLLFLFSIECQAVYNAKDDSLLELGIYLTIPHRELKFITRDSSFFARYEVQLQVFDQAGNQLTGDYWEKEVPMDTTDVRDSIKLTVPKISKKFSLRLIDLYAQEIFNITEKILPVKFLGNIRWLIDLDTLSIKFTIINPHGEADSLDVSINQLHKNTQLKTGNYDDSLSLLVNNFPVGDYAVNFKIYRALKKIDEITLPIKIIRPFYLDDKTWQLKVSQLEYIATPSEIAQLKLADKEMRDSLWQGFWNQYDPTPNTANNERESEYFSRIVYAEEHFSFGDKGWRSDRGKIYVKYGPPDEIQSRPYELSSRPYEVWLYYKINLKFIFYDRHGFGEYLLINPEGERI